MNRTFRDVLRIYRRASTRTDYGLAALPYSPMHPIRLIVSRSLDCNGSSQPTSAHSITVPQSSVLFEAAKLAADVKEGSKNQSLSMTASPTISPDAIQFHEGSLLLIDGSKTSSDVNLSDQMEGGVVIEEATSVDDASGKVEALGSPQLNVDGSDFNKVSTPPSVSPVTGFYQAYPAKSITFESEETSTCHLLSQEEKVLLQNHWRSVLNDDAEIIIGEYTLPSANAPLGISVETLGSIDRVGRQTDFRHRIVEVCRDGVVASQTGLEPMDEVLEVNGVTVMGKDSAFLTSTLQKPRISGYLVCSRSPNTISDQRHSSSTLTEDKMSVILEVSSSGTTQNDTVPVELEPGIERDETVSSSGSKISDLRRKFEAFSQKKTSTAPKSPVEAKVGDSKIAHRRPTQLRDLDDEQLSPSDASIISTNDSIEIIINKAKGELIGVTLGQKDDASGGFTVTDIAPNGALRRTLNSVAVYRRVHFDVGDVVTELNGTHLRHATLFGVQSLLWSMFSLEGTVSLKFTSKASTKSQHTVSAEVHERRPIDRILKPGTSASKPNVSSVSSTSKLSGCGAFLLDISSPVIKTSGAHVHASSMETTRVPSKAPGRSNEVVSNSDNSLAQSTNSSSNLYQPPQLNRAVTTTSSLKLSLNSHSGFRMRYGNNSEGRPLRKSISDDYETFALRVPVEVSQEVNLWNEVAGCIYATHVSPSSQKVEQPPMQAQPMKKSNNPEGRTFERSKRDAFEQNWSEIFSVLVNPDDEKLEIKVACGSLCGIGISGVIVCDLCALSSKLPLKIGDQIVQVENAPVADGERQNVTPIRLLVKRLKECPSLSSSDSSPEIPERQWNCQIHEVSSKKPRNPKEKMMSKYASMMRTSCEEIKELKRKGVPIEKKMLRCIQDLPKGGFMQRPRHDPSIPDNSALAPRANINLGCLDPPCYDNLQRKYGELSGEIIIVEITVKEIQEILSSNYRNPTVPQQSTTPLSSPTIPVTSFQKFSSPANSRVLKTLGISLCGNKDLNQMAVLVCGLRPGSIAEVDGRITVGDQLLELNEHVLYGRSHLNAGPLIRSCLLSVLHRSSNKRSKTPSSLCFVICRNPDNLTNMAVAPLSYVTNSQKVSRRSSVDTSSGAESPPRSILQVQGSPIGRSTFEEVHATRLLRGRNGFGFAIMDKSFTNEPGIYIKQLVENSPAALDGTLRAGDRILRVDWHDALHASYDSVLEWLRSARHQVRIVVSRVRLLTGDTRPLEDEESYKMGFRKRLSAPLISSLIHAFMHPSSSSASSKKSSLQLASMVDTVSPSEGGGGLDDPKHKGLHRPTVSETFDLLSPNIGVLNEVRRASCPDEVIPGFAKRLAAKNFLGVVPMSSLTQLAGPPIPVLPLGVVGIGGGDDGGSNKTTEAALRGRYEAALERIAAAYHSSHSRRIGTNCDEVESATTRSILPGQKTLIRIRKNPSLSLGISLIGGSETSLGVLQVHEIFPEGAVALDGRLEPGDRLLAVNNEPLSNLPYAVAVSTIATAFSGQTPLQSELDLSSVVAAASPSHCADDSGFITLVVERPGAGVQTKWYDQEVTADLPKKPGRGLGLCIVERSGPTLVTANGVSFSSAASTASATTVQNVNQYPTVRTERSGLGVIVCDLIKGSTAQMDGRIMIGDQILAINDVDVESSSQEEVATLLKTAQGTISLRLGRLKNQPIPLNSVAAAFRAKQ